jgi:hypothetical protein
MLESLMVRSQLEDIGKKDQRHLFEFIEYFFAFLTEIEEIHMEFFVRKLLTFARHGDKSI